MKLHRSHGDNHHGAWPWTPQMCPNAPAPVSLFAKQRQPEEDRMLENPHFRMLAIVTVCLAPAPMKRRRDADTSKLTVPGSARTHTTNSASSGAIYNEPADLRRVQCKQILAVGVCACVKEQRPAANPTGNCLNSNRPVVTNEHDPIRRRVDSGCLSVSFPSSWSHCRPHESQGGLSFRRARRINGTGAQKRYTLLK